MKFLLLLLLLLFYSSTLFAGRSTGFFYDLHTFFTEEELINISPEKLNRSWENVQQKIEDHLINGGPEGTYISWYRGTFPSLINRSFNNLAKRKRIFSLTPEIRIKLNIDKKYCFERTYIGLKCSTVNAFYLPQLNVIFIDENLTEDNFSISLFHELIHYYQNVYRLPIDLYLLNEIALELPGKEAHLLKKDLFNILNFHYETQAHWYSLTLEQDALWFDYAATSNPFLNGVKIAATLVTELLFCWAPTSPLELTTEYINSFMPNIMKRQSDIGHFKWSGKLAFYIPELVVTTRKTLDDLFSFSNIDLSTHAHFANQLIEAQFGDIPFFWVSGNQAQKTFATLINNYYNTISEGVFDGESRPYGCGELLDNIEFDGTSPLLQWYTIDEKYFDVCYIYKDVAKKSLRQELINSYLDFDQDSSPYVIIPAAKNFSPSSKKKKKSGFLFGGEGSTPELLIFPEIEVTPSDDLSDNALFEEERVENEDEPDYDPDAGNCY